VVQLCSIFADGVWREDDRYTKSLHQERAKLMPSFAAVSAVVNQQFQRITA
jgi:hypothetical protein